MTLLQKLRESSIIGRVASIMFMNYYTSSGSHRYAISSISSFRIAQGPRFYSNKMSAKLENNDEKVDSVRIPKAVREQAQEALLEYLHSTRGLPFVDAENLSKDSPSFLIKLLKMVGNETEIQSSLARFLRYHPINEFEPFFESMGLEPCEYSAFLPKNMMFLNDDPVLLKNYRVFCNYGVPRNMIGRIYKEAAEVFRYNSTMLQSKLIAFEEIGLSQSTVVKLVASSPCLLVNNGNKEFLEVVEILEGVGIKCDWIGKHIKVYDSYLWKHMLELLCLLTKIGFGQKEQGHLISQHPDLLFKDSGKVAFSVIGFIMKFGATVEEICALLGQFPDIPIEDFIQNLWNSYQLLVEIEMDAQEIGLIFCSYPVVLGSCKIKKLNTLLSRLRTGKKRLCKVIKEDPQILKNWVYGAKLKPLPDAEEEKSHTMKTRFLLGLGFARGSCEMERAIKLYRGKGLELQERFSCFVDAGMNPKDVIQMVKSYPHILNQSKDVIRVKIDYLVNGLGYPVSSLVRYPTLLNYTTQRVKLRFSMINWLKGQGRVHRDLSLSTIFSSSEKTFTSTYVDKHPGGPEHWEKLKKEIY